MKILFLGHLNEGQTSRMRMEELRRLGHEVAVLSSQALWSNASWLSRQLQQRIARGPVVSQLNERLVTLARTYKPDLLWADKQEHIYPETLETLRRLGILLLHFTPDPYFTLRWKRTHLMDVSLPLFDYLVTSKRYELPAYRATGREVIYMPLGFSESAHRPLSPRDHPNRERFTGDIAFIGGWEPRREALLAALGTTDADLRIWGYAWDHLVDGRWTPRRAYRLRLLAGADAFRIAVNPIIQTAYRGGEVYGDEYAWALSGAKINVGFLRTVWPDQHTTRTFEIPACASMLLADRTDEHREFFEEGVEAEFFASTEELLDKARYYLQNEAVRARMAMNGYERCHRSGYSYRERVGMVLRQIDIR